MLLYIRGCAREVDPNPTPIDRHAEFDQGVVGGVEVEALGELGCGAKTPVEAVGPAVIGASDLAGIEGVADGGQLMTSMTANVGEGTEGTIGVATEQNSLASDLDGPQLTGGEQLVETAHAIPGCLPQVLCLPGENIGGEVGLGRKGETLTEVSKDLANVLWIQWCRSHPISLRPSAMTQCILNGESGYRRKVAHVPR
jgi:hypothetical protein